MKVTLQNAMFVVACIFMVYALYQAYVLFRMYMGFRRLDKENGVKKGSEKHSTNKMIPDLVKICKSKYDCNGAEILAEDGCLNVDAEIELPSGKINCYKYFQKNSNGTFTKCDAEFSGTYFCAPVGGACINKQTLDCSRKTISNLNLSNQNFTGYNFSNTTFINTILDNVNFENANLSGALFNNSHGNNVNFNNAIMKHTQFNGSSFENSKFTHIINTDFGFYFKYGSLSGSTFSDSDLSLNKNLNSNSDKPELLNVDCTGTKFIGVKLNNLNFLGCTLDSADFKNADLTNSYFQHSTLVQTNFGGSNLTETNFYGTKHFMYARFNKCTIFKNTINDKNNETSLKDIRKNITNPAGMPWSEWDKTYNC
jgi:uncharacterized protein YjbI with pentapeptide repeats